MNYKLDMLFAKPVMVFDDLASTDEHLFMTDWLEKHIRSNAVKKETNSPLFSVISTHEFDPQLQNNAELTPLVNGLLEATKIFANTLGYVESAERMFIKDMWAVIEEPGSVVQSHIHQNSFISGAYYMKVPDGSKLMVKDYTNLWKMPDRWNEYNKFQQYYDCVPNRLIMWRSDVVHGTPPIPEGSDKICVSFNIQFHPDDLFAGGPTQNPRSVK